MKGNNSSHCINGYRKLVDNYLDLQAYNSALFWADKVVALSNGNPKDVYKLAQCMFHCKQYHRAACLLKSRNLDKTNLLCNCLTVRCYLEANELNSAMKSVNVIDVDMFSHNNNVNSQLTETLLFDGVSKNQALSSLLLLKGRVFEALDNRSLAAEYYRQALHTDVYCFEAFDSLIKHHMLTAVEEQELLNSLPLSEQCSSEESQVLLKLYGCKLKKYHTLTEVKKGDKSEFTASLTVSNKGQSGSNKMQSTPKLTIIAPSLSNYPNEVTASNNKNVNSDKKVLKQNEPEEINTEEGETVLLTRLNDSLDIAVAQAERLYYNCDYNQCATLTEAILKIDPYHNDCLPIHISCQVELKQTNKLFALAHKLVDLYPNLAISWFAVGCYYYLIGKSDYARRFLQKATCLDKLFGPAWLAYGHSFANENEHDQAMAAYFKATQLMKGCHLPLLYIGLECGLTNNIRLADKFFQQARNIAPDDPFVMHEMGVIAFQNLDYIKAEKHFITALEIIKKVKGSNLIPERWGPLLNNLGHTCRKLKKYVEALSYHHQALLLSPQTASTYSAIAYVHILMGHSDEAVDWFHRALAIRRDDTFSTTMLNYVIEQLCEEKPAFPDAPDDIPKFESKPKLSISVEESMKDDSPLIQSGMNEISDMSIEVEMSDVSEVNKD